MQEASVLLPEPDSPTTARVVPAESDEGHAVESEKFLRRADKVSLRVALHEIFDF